MEDGRAAVFLCGFSNNGGYNLINNGREDISAIQNWWGSTSEDAILTKLRDAAKDSRFGQVEVAPWLRDKPTGMP